MSKYFRRLFCLMREGHYFDITFKSESTFHHAFSVIGNCSKCDKDREVIVIQSEELPNDWFSVPAKDKALIMRMIYE